MSILVIGASGFVGHHLVPALREHVPNSVRLVAAGRGHFGAPQSGIEHAAVDVTDQDSVDALFERLRPTRVIHLAALSSVQQAHLSTAKAYDVNVGGTLAIASAMRRFVPGAALLFASTGEVYGRTFLSGQALNEDAPVLPANPYARSKLAAEIVLQDRLSDVCPVITLRLLNHTGAGQDERFVAPSFAAQIARIEVGAAAPVVKVGNLSAERDFLDIADVVDAYIHALGLLDRQRGYSLFNIASGEARSIASILEALRRLSRVPFEVETDPARMRPSDIARAICDAAAFRAATGWMPKRPFADTVSSLLDWWRTQASWPSGEASRA